jgi:hypothetical protein
MTLIDQLEMPPRALQHNHYPIAENVDLEYASFRRVDRKENDKSSAMLCSLTMESDQALSGLPPNNGLMV